MPRLTAPNGAIVNVSDAKAARLLGQGYSKPRTDRSSDKDAAPGSQGVADVSPYKALKVADLKALIAERNQGREPDTHLPTAGKLTVLRAALEADDKALAAAAATADEGDDPDDEGDDPDDIDTGEQ